MPLFELQNGVNRNKKGIRLILDSTRSNVSDSFDLMIAHFYLCPNRVLDRA